MRIAINKFVSVTYDLKVGEGEELELMERATQKEPMNFIFGIGLMLPAFEEKVKGLSVGDKFQFTITPADAYGEYNEEHLMELPKSLFEVDGKFESDMVKEGNIIPMMDNDGKRLNGSVMEVQEDIVIMDFNHPLAGETLHFTGEVIDVHDPSEEELAAITGEGEGGCSDEDCCSCHGCQ
jgi:FKBP-type peptidyl-prolyl cis-trans isomerase SlyD